MLWIHFWVLLGSSSSHFFLWIGGVVYSKIRLGHIVGIPKPDRNPACSITFKCEYIFPSEHPQTVPSGAVYKAFWQVAASPRGIWLSSPTLCLGKWLMGIPHFSQVLTLLVIWLHWLSRFRYPKLGYPQQVHISQIKVLMWVQFSKWASLGLGVPTNSFFNKWRGWFFNMCFTDLPKQCGRYSLKDSVPSCQVCEHTKLNPILHYIVIQKG